MNWRFWGNEHFPSLTLGFFVLQKSKKGFIQLERLTTKFSSQPTRCFKIRKRVFRSKVIRIFIVPRSILVALAHHDTSSGVKQSVLTRVSRYSHQLASTRFILAPQDIIGEGIQLRQERLSLTSYQDIS